jgi:glycerol-3-phosphate dehydrogenase
MIAREALKASKSKYDLIIIGGGIYGACLALESARCGLKPLVLERDDFGGATSWNTGRIIHGGLRSLQRLDLPGALHMMNERRWFFRNFPDLVRPMPFLMPLYGRGLKRGFVFQAGLEANGLLSRHRNEGVRADRLLPKGQILTREETIQRFPMVDRKGLKNGGLWYDGMLSSPQRLLMEALRWACEQGAMALNYVEATGLLTESGKSRGVEAFDHMARQNLVFRGDAVVNCAGPWSRLVAESFDQDIPSLFKPFLIFKFLLDRTPLSEAALAVQPKRPHSRVYFAYPCGGKVLAGGFHAPWTSDVIKQPEPTEQMIQTLVDDLNLAIPGLNIRSSHVLRIYAGLIPARTEGSDEMALRHVIWDHGQRGGPDRLISVCGFKYTSARKVGESVLRGLFPLRGQNLRYRPGTERKPTNYPVDLHDPEKMLQADSIALKDTLQRIRNEEAVVHTEDLLLRRTDWACNPLFKEQVLSRIQSLL